jgi:hypothetical protein
MEQWIEREYPQIKRLAQREKAETYFEDDVGIRSDPPSLGLVSRISECLKPLEIQVPIYQRP